MAYPKRIGPYTIETLLGSGGFGDVLLGVHEKTLERFAIKLSLMKKSLAKEYNILKELANTEGIPNVYDYRRLDVYDYFVTDLLGKCLNYQKDDKILTLECVCAIGIELIDRLESIHNRGIIHKDIKPSQFLISIDSTKIFLVDFGLSSHFMVDGAHKSFKTRCRCKGSVSFASVNNHMGFKQSRRDDLESLCYSIIYLIRGKLP